MIKSAANTEIRWEEFVQKEGSNEGFCTFGEAGLPLVFLRSNLACLFLLFLDILHLLICVNVVKKTHD